MTKRWNNYFLRIALESARMSKDPRTQVGAVLVGQDREIRSTGFNGLPRGIIDKPELLADRDTKLKLIVHAEMNAILNAARAGISTRGCTLYIAATDSSGLIWGGPPCTRCTVEIIQAGINTIISHPFKSGPSRWRDDIERVRRLLDESGVRFLQVPTN